jgi:hypothetical protein
MHKQQKGLDKSALPSFYPRSHDILMITKGRVLLFYYFKPNTRLGYPERAIETAAALAQCHC